MSNFFEAFKYWNENGLSYKVFKIIILCSIAVYIFKPRSAREEVLLYLYKTSPKLLLELKKVEKERERQKFTPLRRHMLPAHK